MTSDVVELATARFRLEPLAARHAEPLFPLLSAPEIYRYVTTPPPTSVESLAARYHRLESRHSADGTEWWLNWAIRFPTEGRFAGVVEATVYPDHEASLAYLLAPAYWGQGYAAESCAAVVAHLYADWAVVRIEATVDTNNARSIRLLERLGFTRTATRPSEDVIAGAPSTEHVYAHRRTA